MSAHNKQELGLDKESQSDAQTFISKCKRTDKCGYYIITVHCVEHRIVSHYWKQRTLRVWRNSNIILCKSTLVKKRDFHSFIYTNLNVKVPLKFEIRNIADFFQKSMEI